MYLNSFVTVVFPHMGDVLDIMRWSCITIRPLLMGALRGLFGRGRVPRGRQI